MAISRLAIRSSSNRKQMVKSVGISLSVQASVLLGLSLWCFEVFELPKMQDMEFQFVEAEKKKSDDKPQKVPNSYVSRPQAQVIVTHDPVAISLPTWEQPSIPVMDDLVTHRLPTDDELGDVILDRTPVQINSSPVRATNRAVQQAEAEISPDKPARYKHTPPLPKSMNLKSGRKIHQMAKVAIYLSAKGLPTRVDLMQTSGHHEADQLLVAWVKNHWTFYPAEKDNKPISSKVVVPVRIRVS